VFIDYEIDIGVLRLYLVMTERIAHSKYQMQKIPELLHSKDARQMLPRIVM
jgi:hypothetical protein